MINVNEDSSRLDFIHAPVLVYRNLLDAMARPGTIRNISRVSEKLALSSQESCVGFALALTLLDSEVSFHVSMRNGSSLEESICRRTYCKAVELSRAQYIFLDGDIDNDSLLDILPQINCGSLDQPELGATVLVLANALHAASAEEANLSLSGPGIETVNYCKVKGLSPLWFAERKKINAEYPMGIDLILFDKEGNLLAIPRTTHVKEAGTP